MPYISLYLDIYPQVAPRLH